MSALGQHMFELQEFAYDLMADKKLSYDEARKIFVERYRGAGYLFDELWKEGMYQEGP